MVKRLVLLGAVTFLLGLDLYAQKIKYKDLFVLLNAKDFDQAEPFLRRYMVQDPDHANATFNFALFYVYKVSQQDPLKETDQYLAYSDSTIMFYEKAHGLITEKEVKKNEEYYQSYSRRDLRTGKYGVKMEDIHFDIENKVIKLKETKASVIKLKEYFVASQGNYDSAQYLYNTLRDKFIDYQHFLFTSNEEDLAVIERIGLHYESMNNNFTRYKSELVLVPKSGYKQALIVERLEEFPEIASADFYAGAVTVYDFKTWASEVTAIITNEILPLKANMEEYDLQLEDLLTKTKTDSQTVDSELAALTEKMIFDQLKNYDDDPLPSNLFDFKVKEIKFYSYVNHSREDGYLDSLNVDFQIFMYEDLRFQFNPVQAALQKLNEQDLDLGVDFYREFINAKYGGKDGFEKYLDKKSREFSEEADRVTGILDSLTLRTMWATIEADTIPMFINDSLRINQQVTAQQYTTLDVDTLRTEYWISGIKKLPKSMSGFIARVNYNYEVDTLFKSDFAIPVSSTDTLILLKSNIYAVDENKVVIFYASGISNNYCNVNFLDSGALSWSKSIQQAAKLENFVVDSSNGQLIMTFKESEESTDTIEIRFDLEGKVLE